MIVAIEGLFYLSQKLTKEHPIIITINQALGLCYSFFPFIIYTKYNKRNKTTNLFLFEKKMNTSNHNKKITKKRKIFMDFIMFCS